MPIIQIIIVLIVIGLLLWLVNTYLPMAAPIETILHVVVVILVVLWLLNLFYPHLGSVRIGHPVH